MLVSMEGLYFLVLPEKWSRLYPLEASMAWLNYQVLTHEYFSPWREKHLSIKPQRNPQSLEFEHRREEKRVERGGKKSRTFKLNADNTLPTLKDRSKNKSAQLNSRNEKRIWQVDCNRPKQIHCYRLSRNRLIDLLEFSRLQHLRPHRPSTQARVHERSRDYQRADRTL